MTPCAGGWVSLAALLTSLATHPARADSIAPPSASPSDITWAQVLLAAPRALLDPRLADPDWHIPPSSADSPSAEIPPEQQRLEQALRQHLEIQAAGGWPVIPEGEDLRAGMRDPAVAVLRERLKASGDYGSEMGADPWFLDGNLRDALRNFQQRHGMPPTGVLDAPTRDAANIGLADRIGQLAVTLERWRWLPRDRGARYVWVNVGSLSLDIVENGRSLQSMRVIVGHPDRPTPSLAGQMRQVVFNPTWSVPRSIAVEDLLPRQLEDPNFLASRGFRVFRGSGADEQPVDPASVDWQGLGAGYFPYRLRQDAGPGNSLGRIKIAWDNPYDIYLHDTPAKGLFGLGRRTLSSGCVRMEDAPAVATYLLAHDRDWTTADTTSRVNNETTQVINLRQHLPVYIVYLTAWADADGRVNFRRDVYGRDARVLASLRAAGAGGML